MNPVPLSENIRGGIRAAGGETVARTRLALFAAVLAVASLLVASSLGNLFVTAAVLVMAMGTTGFIAITYLRLRRRRKAGEKAHILRRVAALEEHRASARGRPGR
jgi:hypothetical protein